MVQEQLKIRKRKSGASKAKTNYLFSGKLYCGLCDGIMTGETGTSKLNIVYQYYKCSTKKRFHTCNKNTVKKEWIENLILDETCKHIFKSGFYQKIIDTIYELYIKEFEKDDTLKILNSNKTKTQNEIQNLINCYKMGLATKTTQKELLELETQLEKIEIEIKKAEVIKNNRLTRDHIEFMFEQYKNYDFSDEKKNERFIDTFVQKVILYEDKIIIIYNYSGDNSQEIKKSETEEISTFLAGSDLSQMVEMLGVEPRSKK
ncbi:MAG: zinc ribbon domain-containing protein [Clostridia bacterium]|nr:zinc ribbon domain-containing protein [Clostridia bacterium]